MNWFFSSTSVGVQKIEQSLLGLFCRLLYLSHLTSHFLKETALPLKEESITTNYVCYINMRVWVWMEGMAVHTCNPSYGEMTKPAQSVNRFSRQERGVKRKETIRQHCSLTPASSEAEAGLFFTNLLLYHFNYMQVIRSVLGWGTSKTINTNSRGPSKAINKVPKSLLWSPFLRAYQDDQDIRVYFPVPTQSHILAGSLLLCSSLKSDSCLNLLPCPGPMSSSCQAALGALHNQC